MGLYETYKAQALPFVPERFFDVPTAGFILFDWGTRRYRRGVDDGGEWPEFIYDALILMDDDEPQEVFWHEYWNLIEENCIDAVRPEIWKMFSALDAFYCRTFGEDRAECWGDVACRIGPNMDVMMEGIDAIDRLSGTDGQCRQGMKDIFYMLRMIS